MTAPSWVTRHATLETLWCMRAKFCRDAEIRESRGDVVFAGVSLKLVELIDRELYARGELPIGFLGEIE